MKEVRDMKSGIRKILVVTLALALCFSMMLPAYAAAPEAETKAAALKQLGLFMGVSDTDFALDRAPTRVEALVMLLRTLSVEDDAKASTATHPFTDVPVGQTGISHTPMKTVLQRACQIPASEPTTRTRICT